MKKIGRRAFAAVLGAALFTLSACSGGAPQPGGAGTSSPSGSEVAMGRYVETEFAMPQGITRTGGIVQKQDGTLEMLATQSEGVTAGTWDLYTSSDGGSSWQKQEAPWLSHFDSSYPTYTLDGQGELHVSYTVYTPEVQAMMDEALKTGEMPPAEAFPVPQLAKVDAQGNVSDLPIQWKKGEDGRVDAGSIAVADNGTLVANHYGSFVQYDLGTGEPKNEFLVQSYSGMVLYGNTLGVLTDQGIEQFDLENGETLEVIPIESGMEDASLALGHDGKTLFLCSGRGIYRYVLGGSVWERVLDGELTSLNMPSVYISSLIEKEDGGFLVLTESADTHTLLGFTFSQEVPAVPTSELVVYSLRDNDTVRQAVGFMQRANPDMRINMQVAVDGESAITQTDAVRALNTELLAGKGPDVLVLDSLPVASYTEKGVLQDLAGLVQPGVQSGELLANVVTAYEQEGKIYAVPTRFGVPQLWGSASLVEGANDLGALADRIVAAHEQNPSMRILYHMEPEKLLRDFYITCAPAWRQEDGSIKEAEFTRFLQDIKRIADCAVAPDGSSLGEYAAMADFEQEFDFRTAGGVYWLNDMVQAVNGLSLNMEDVAAPEAVARYKGDGVFAIEPGQAQNVFVPLGVLGLNANSGQAEKARAFISLALEQRVQQHKFDDGYAVNVAALEKSAESPYPEGDDGMQSMVFAPDGTFKIFQILWPDDATMDSILTAIKGLDTPSNVDEVLLGMIVDETADYFAGGKSVEEAVAAVAARTKAYLAE